MLERQTVFCLLIFYQVISSGKFSTSQNTSLLRKFLTWRSRAALRRQRRYFLLALLSWHVLETLEFFEISHGSYQPLKFLPYLTLSTPYPMFISLLFQVRRKHVKVGRAKWETTSTAGGSYKRRRREHLRGPEDALPENFENVTPLKCDLQHFQTKSIIFLLHRRAKNRP